MGEPGHSERQHFFGAAKLIAALTMLSRVFGMLRDIAIASLGATRATSAFVIAFQIPNLFRRLFAEGALSAAFVPTFTDTAEEGGFEKAARLFANAFAIAAVFLLAVCVLGWLVLLAWGLLWPGEWDRRMLLELTAVMLPFMVTVCLLALGSAALNCRGHFAYPAAAPILLNLVIIAAAWLIAPLWRGETFARLYVIAVSVTVAGILQLAALIWLLRSHGFAGPLSLRPVQPGIRTMARLIGPMLLGLGFLQIAELLQSLIAWSFAATETDPTLTILGMTIQRPLNTGAVVRIYAARRLYQLPLGVLAISLGVAVFPLLSRYATRGDRSSFRDALNRALRLATLESFATGVGLIVLARPIMRLVFAWKNFTTADADASAFILQMYAAGMWAYCLLTIFLRAFYALKDVKTPMIVSCVLVVVSLVMVLALVWIPALGAGAFGVSTAVTAVLNVLTLAILLRRRMGRFGGRKLAVSTLRSAAAAGVMTGVIYLLWWLVGWRAASGLVVAVCVPGGAAAFLAAAALLRAPELRELWSARRRDDEPAPPPQDV